MEKIKLLLVEDDPDWLKIMESFLNTQEDMIVSGAVATKEEAIRSTYHNCSPIEIVLKDYARLKREELLQGLTPAERKIYDLVEKGQTQQQIETNLHIAGQTVKNHIGSQSPHP